MFSLFKSRNNHYNPPPGPPPRPSSTSYNPPPGPPPSLARYNPPPTPHSSVPLPSYSPAGGQSHEDSERNATQADFDAADSFCQQHPVIPARFYDHKEFGAEEWGLLFRDATADPTRDPTAYPVTSISVDENPVISSTHELLVCPTLDRRTAYYRNRGDACLTSNLPIIAGQYSNAAKDGVYFEITIHKMSGEGTTIALGMQCLPYPQNRLPGWHRRSAALHLDDCRIYFDNSEGGTDYKFDDGRDAIEAIKVNNPYNPLILGCGYEFVHGGVGHLFFTHNGKLLPIALHGIFDYDGRQAVDVFAAVGITNAPVHFSVNFGRERFKWQGPSHGVAQKQWSQKDWTVDGLFEYLGDAPPPQYAN